MLKKAAVGLVPAVLVAVVLGASYFAPTSLHGTLVSCTYNSPTPVVTLVTPGSGPIFGSTHITITGTGFCNGTDSVTFGGVAAPGVVFVSDTKILATSPAHSAGVVDVQVRNTGGISTTSSKDIFRYVSAGWCALIDMSRAPTVWTKGHSQTFYVYAFNCGTTTWPATISTRVDVSVHFTTRAGSGFWTGSYWRGNSYHNLSKNIAPNSYATFAITVAPSASGTLLLEGEMIKLHQFWFGRYLYRPQQFVWVTATVS